MRLTPKAVTDGEDFDLVRRAGIQIFQDDMRFCGQGGRTFAGVISVVGYLELLLLGIHVALPGDVQALLDGLQIFDYGTSGTCRLVQDGLVRLDFIADRFNYYRIISSW